MTKWLKHTGVINNLQKKIVVVMMQLPEKLDHALVTDTEALPPKLHQSVMDAVESKEGQNTVDLYEVLQRRMMVDSTEPLLTYLFKTNYLQSVPVNQITMIPAPGLHIPLVDIINGINESKGLPPLDVQSTVNPNVIQQNLSLVQTENNAELAKGLLAQADLLLEEAEMKRQQAYKISPELRPSTPRLAKQVVVETAKPKKTTVKKSVKA